MTDKNSQGDTFQIQDFAGIGMMKGGKAKIGSANNNKTEKPNLAEAAQEIQQLLEQLSQTYRSETTSEQMVLAGKAIEQIERNSTLREKIISALKAGSASALAQALNHPAASFVIGAVQDWTKKS